VIRFLTVVGLTAAVAAASLLLVEPAAIAAWFDDGGRSMSGALIAVLAGVVVTSLLLLVYVHWRLGRLVIAAERISRGDYTVEVREKGRGLEGRLGRAINGIARAVADTHDRATVDRLTGVVNRTTLMGALFSEVERAARYDRPLSVAFVDIDHFKAVNDTYGHEAGDVVLRGVADTIAENLRASDLVGRYGGEEFMLVLTETTVEDGAALAEKLRTLVERRRFAVEGNPSLSVTLSIGLAGGVGSRVRMDNLVRDADAAMYSAKSLGRNQTYIFSEPDDDARVPRAPISAAGRAHALAIGRAAREAATSSLASVIAPLPHQRGRPSPVIASIVRDLGAQLDLSGPEMDRLQVAAMLHDVGKVAIPAEVLDKPAPLTTAEWRTVVQHPRIGQVILEQAAALKDAVPLILHHHERYGGSGYPFGLRANEIPLGARILAIADAYDAMTHDRPYRRAMSHEEAIEELRRHAGTQFDPELVTLFCDLYASRAPEPDATMLAIAAAEAVHSTSDRGRTDPASPERRPRRRAATSTPATSTPATSTDGSTTMAAPGDGSVVLDRLRDTAERRTPAKPDRHAGRSAAG
jgi:diguanylate cyclase (GGDEF)-like protein